MAAIPRGEQFDGEGGLPTTELRAQHASVTWNNDTPTHMNRKRACLSDGLGLAVEGRSLTTPVNPLTTVKWVAPKSAEEVDPESVASARQVRALLKGVREQGTRGAHLEGGASPTRPCDRLRR